MKVICDKRCLIGEGPFWNEWENDMKVGPDGRLYVRTQSGKRRGTSDKVDGVDLEKDAKAGVTFLYKHVSRGRKPYLFGS